MSLAMATGRLALLAASRANDVVRHCILVMSLKTARVLTQQLHDHHLDIAFIIVRAQTEIMRSADLQFNVHGCSHVQLATAVTLVIVTNNLFLCIKQNIQFFFSRRVASVSLKSTSLGNISNSLLSTV